MKLQFELTCIACPEQYDVWHKSENIGYVRERHDLIQAEYKEGIIFEKSGDFGDFKDNSERIELLTKIAKMIAKCYMTEKYGKILGNLIYLLTVVEINEKEIIDRFSNIEFKIPEWIMKPITYIDIIRRIVDFSFEYDEEHKPTQEKLEEQKNLLKQVIDFNSMSETEKEETGTWLYLIYCYNEHNFRIIEKQVEPKDVFLDEIILTIPIGTKEDMARNIEEQVSILQSLRKIRGKEG